MFVTHLSVTDFRNYAGAELDLVAGVNVFVGSNGQGKTNLVEAVEYLSTMSSHRVSATTPLIRAGAESAILRARVQASRDDERLITLELEVANGRSNILCRGPATSSARCVPSSSHPWTWPSCVVTHRIDGPGWTPWSPPVGRAWLVCERIWTRSSGNATRC